MIDFILLMAATAAATPADRAAIFKAAGATRRGAAWTMCPDDPQARATIERFADLNGDGRPEAVVTETSLQCYGGDEAAFNLVGKQANGSWRTIFASGGVPEFLKTKGAGGWPDISIEGQGFCFPVVRWNGREYTNHRKQYQGKPCR